MSRDALLLLVLVPWLGSCGRDEVALGEITAGSSGSSSGGASGDSTLGGSEDGWSSTAPGTSGSGSGSSSGESTGAVETTTSQGSSSGLATGTDGSSGGSSTSSTGADTDGATGSSGDPSTSGTSTGGTSTGGTSTGGTSTGGTSSAGSESSSGTGGDTDGGGTCEGTVARTHVGGVASDHAGDRFVTFDAGANLVLWDAATLDVLFETRPVDRAEIAAGTLAYDSAAHDVVSIVDATTGTPTATVPYAFVWGVASDGSYVWTASGTALSVYELDGSLRWSVADSFLGVHTLALPDALHVYAPQQSTTEVLHVSADAGVVDSDAFTGSFGGWFADAPRYWTQQGMAYRVYDVDNTLLALELGTPWHGWGTRLVVDWNVIDVSDPDTVLANIGGDHLEDGAAVLWRTNDGAATLIELDTDPITITAVAPGCCITDDSPSFSYAQGHWLLGGDHGTLTDELGRAPTVGQVDAIAGSTAGRMALALHGGVLHVADVGADCSWNEISSFPRTGRDLRMSGDGTTLLSTERWTPMFGSNRDGTRIYALPDGALQAESSLSVMSDSLQGHDISDDASVWSRMWTNTGLGSYAVAGAVTLFDFGLCIPLIAPDAQHVVISDGGTGIFPTWSSSTTYFYDPQDFAGVIDGVAHGFIDQGHVLVGHYADCGGNCISMTSSDIVDMTGTVVATTTLPDLRRLRRIDDGAAVAFDAAGNGAIYDIMGGVLLWQAPAGAAVEVAGPDHVLVSTGARVDVVRWR